MPQGELFEAEGETTHPVESRRVRGAAEGVIRRTSPFPPGIFAGTSSWSFPGWSGLVYQGEHTSRILAAEGLSAYASHPLFRTVGVDRGYYRPLSPEILRDMAGRVPEGFRFLVKAPVQVTGPRLRGPRREVNPDFLDPAAATALAVAPFIEGLGERGGVLLFQFPPMGIRSPQRGLHFLEWLGRFLRELPRGPTYGVELRDRILWGDPLRRTLAESGAVPGFAVHPAAPPLRDQIQLAPPGDFPVTVARWLLPPGADYEGARDAFSPFRSLQAPDPGHREILADLARDGLRAGRPVFIVVNNKAEGSAPLSVAALADALGKGPGGPAGERLRSG